MFDSTGPSFDCKKAHSNKSSISLSFPVQVSFSPEGTPAPYSSSVPPAPLKVKKHMENFNKVRKELYFSSKAMLRGRVIHLRSILIQWSHNHVANWPPRVDKSFF